MCVCVDVFETIEVGNLVDGLKKMMAAVEQKAKEDEATNGG